MPGTETMLRVYNHVVNCYLDLFMNFGNLSSGRRYDLYNVMAPDSRPTTYENWEHVFEHYREMGCTEDLRKVWNLIRMTKHGNIEFRMFDSTPNSSILNFWAESCHEACLEVM